MEAFEAVEAENFGDAVLVLLGPLTDWFIEAFGEDGIGVDEEGLSGAFLVIGGVILFFGVEAVLILEPVPDDGIPGVEVVAGGLFGAGGLDNGVVDEPPEAGIRFTLAGTFLEEGEGFGPKLIAIAVDGVDIDGGAGDGPPAAATGFILEVGFLVGGGGEDALAVYVDGAMAVGGAVVVFAAGDERFDDALVVLG